MCFRMELGACEEVQSDSKGSGGQCLSVFNDNPGVAEVAHLPEGGGQVFYKVVSPNLKNYLSDGRN
jgi:hypothetical protein